MQTVSYADLKMTDYAEALALWQATPGVGLSSADQPERIQAYLERNPGLSFVARAGGELIGAVLCGHDGRRGYLHHLAVRPDWRGKGVGRELMRRCLDGLAKAGIDRCHIFVYHDNEQGRRFWLRQGWKERLDLEIMAMDLPV